MVRELFGVTPDAWQDDVLDAFPHRQRQAMLACKGPGKTALLAWLAWNFLLTRPKPKIAATSITGDNLRDGLWTEMAKWQAKSPLLQQAFVWRSERIFAKEAPADWWMSARTWSRAASAEEQADTLAGLHADYMLFLLDEVGGHPDAVMAAAEAALATGVETHIVMAGNPTQLQGPLYRAATSERGLWQVTEITADPDDPKRTPRVSEQWAREQIAKYGRDNPWVLVNVFGRFPPSSLNSLLSVDDVRDAMKREIPKTAYQHSPLVLGVDVADMGEDRSVIFPRQGLQALKPLEYRRQDSAFIAGEVARQWADMSADAALVDATGGWGTGVISAMRQMNRYPISVQFAGESSKPGFLNKRAEMYWDLAAWVREGGSLPDVADLVGELTAPTYTYRGDRLLLEPKDAIKARLGRSPDYADALACTFAETVAPRSTRRQDGPYRRTPNRSGASAWAA